MTDQTAPTSLPVMGNESELDKLEMSVCGLDEDSRVDQVLHIRNEIKFRKQRLAEIDKMMDETLIDWITKNGDIEIGDDRLYVGNTTKTKCRDTEKVVTAFLENHSIEDMTTCMVDQPFKHGACKSRFTDEEYERLFETETVMDLKTGKPKRSIKSVNAKFIK